MNELQRSESGILLPLNYSYQDWHTTNKGYVNLRIGREWKGLWIVLMMVIFSDRAIDHTALNSRFCVKIYILEFRLMSYLVRFSQLLSIKYTTGSVIFDLV